MTAHRIRASHWIAISLLATLLAGCGSSPKSSSSSSSSVSLSSFIPGSRSGGYYQDDGPHSTVPAGLEATPDAVPRIEPYRRSNSKPYRVMGKTYVPITDNRPFTERGIGSWYGKKFHGNPTASGERYNMYKMTAAHPTLPIPSYARVTNLSNGKQVIVRINDRGPFHAGRVIDLSYTAALKLGYINQGRTRIQVDRLLPHDIRRIQAASTRSRPLSSMTNRNVQRQTAQHRQVQPARRALPPATNTPSGIHLQLGAFSQKYYAETMRDQYAATWTGKLPPARVVKHDTVYRLYAGPFTDRAQAASAAAQIQFSGMDKPLIIQR